MLIGLYSLILQMILGNIFTGKYIKFSLFFNTIPVVISVINIFFLFFRVGRTARGEGGKGHALLILRSEEYGFLSYLKQAKVPLNEFEFGRSKISDIQPQLEKLVSKNYFLNLSAKEAFKAYIRSYESHSLKQVFVFNCPLEVRPCARL